MISSLIYPYFDVKLKFVKWVEFGPKCQEPVQKRNLVSPNGRFMSLKYPYFDVKLKFLNLNQLGPKCSKVCPKYESGPLFHRNRDEQPQRLESHNNMRKISAHGAAIRFHRLVMGEVP